MIKRVITREGWLRHCVEEVNNHIFDSDIDLENTEYQIACGWCKSSKALGETVFPYEGEDVSEEDFFPITMHISVTETDVKKIIAIVIHEFIHAFYNIRNHGKRFKTLAIKAGFEKPFTELHISEQLEDKIDVILEEMTRKHGEFPGKPVKPHRKEDKERKKTIFKLFCPDCGFTVKAKKDDVDKFGRPRCACGGLMALDLEDYEDTENQDT